MVWFPGRDGLELHEDTQDVAPFWGSRPEEINQRIDKGLVSCFPLVKCLVEEARLLRCVT